MSDSVRPLTVWIVSLGLGWEHFQWLELIGFIWVMSGFLMFHGIIPLDWAGCPHKAETKAVEVEEEKAPLTAVDPAAIAAADPNKSMA